LTETETQNTLTELDLLQDRQFRRQNWYSLSQQQYYQSQKK